MFYKVIVFITGAPEHTGTWGHVATIFWNKALRMSYFWILSQPSLRQNFFCPKYLQKRSGAPVFDSGTFEYKIFKAGFIIIKNIRILSELCSIRVHPVLIGSLVKKSEASKNHINVKLFCKIEITRKYPICGFIQGVLTYTTA